MLSSTVALKESCQVSTLFSRLWNVGSRAVVNFSYFDYKNVCVAFYGRVMDMVISLFCMNFHYSRLSVPQIPRKLGKNWTQMLSFDKRQPHRHGNRKICYFFCLNFVLFQRLFLPAFLAKLI